MDINQATQDCKQISEHPERPLCEQCGTAFTPRTGGKPQRFCSVDCRRGFHDRPQRDNVHVAYSDSTALPAVIPPPAAENAPAASPESSEDFDWGDVDGVVLAEQAETAVYWNPKGDLVIRQRNWHDDDSLIFISKNSVDEFIGKLCDVAGIPSVGR